MFEMPSRRARSNQLALAGQKPTTGGHFRALASRQSVQAQKHLMLISLILLKAKGEMVLWMGNYAREQTICAAAEPP
jgi:hypothetical protein